MMPLPEMVLSYNTGSPEGSTGNDTTASTPNATREENKPKVTRRSVACKSCHGLKVKCTPLDINDPSGPCIRCLNANRRCEIDLSQTRKRRKKAEIKEARNEGNDSTSDSKSEIARLKKQVRELQAQLHSNMPYHKTSPSWDNSEYVSKTDLEREITMLCDNQATLTSFTESLKSIADKRTLLLNADRGEMDMISNGLITVKEAEYRLHLYRTKIYQTHQILEIPETVTVQELQKNQPYLLNSIMSIVNTLESPDADVEKSLRIDNFAIQAIAIEVMVMGTKSIELVKAVLLLCLWYNTPELFRNRRYHLLNTIAVTMLHDLGIVNRPLLNFTNDGGICAENPSNKSISLEYQSLVLMLYSNTVSICLMLRRPIYVKWSPYIETCCVNLEISNILRWQKLAVFLRLSNLLDKIHQVVHSTEFAERASTGYIIISEFQNLLDSAKLKISPSDHSNLAFYYSIEAYLHEPCLSSVFTSDSRDHDTAKLTKPSMKAISNCTRSCLNALEEYNQLSTIEAALMPLIYASRVIYTAGMLLRLRFLIISLPSHIEKDLVPQKVITSIQAVNKLVERASIEYPFNNFLKKVRLLLQLFVQTYATQVQELLRKNGVTPQNFRPKATASKELSEMDRLAKMFNEEHANQNPISCEKTTVPLNILSYAATYRRESSSEDKNPQETPQDTPQGKFITKIPYSNYPIPDAQNNNNNNNAPTLPTLPTLPIIPQSQNQPNMHSQPNTQPNIQPQPPQPPIQPNQYPSMVPPQYYTESTPNPTYPPPNNQNNGSYSSQRFPVPEAPTDHSILSVTDEFWADLLSNDADKLGFTNNNFNLNNEVYFS